MYTWLLDLCKAWATNIAIEWFLRKNFKQHYVDTESDNQKSGLINFFFFFILHALVKLWPEVHHRAYNT